MLGRRTFRRLRHRLAPGGREVVAAEAHRFRPLLDNLLHHDPNMVLQDFPAYRDSHLRVSSAYMDPKQWGKMSILNAARYGMISSDRTIREYCCDIWKIGYLQ